MKGQDAASAELMHALGYLYLRAGQASRALVFLLIANRIAPNDPGILRSLVAGLIESGSGERALGAIERLELLEKQLSPETQLLRARALWVVGERAEARRCFRDYVSLRNDS